MGMPDGTPIYLNTVITDRGIGGGRGGSALAVCAAYGGGKSTLLQRITQDLRWVDSRFTKRDYAEDPEGVPLYHHTVIYCPSPIDHWDVFSPRFAHKCFPEPKGFLLHHHENDTLTFYLQRADHQEDFTPSVKEFTRTYRDERHLFDHLMGEGEGKVNVVFPPQTYYLSHRFAKKILTKVGFQSFLLPKRKRGRPTLEEEEAEIDPEALMKEIPTEPHVFYHQLIDHILHEKDSRGVAIVYDDISEFAQAHQTGINFHLIGYFAAVQFPSMRKSNVSFIVASHDIALIDWRVMDRFRTYAWLPSALVPSRLSGVWQSAVRHLNIGYGIIEDREKVGGIHFGRIHYSRIPHQPPVVVTKGMA